MLIGRRKDVQDNNNYIEKYGKITHICPLCGNIYTANIKLDVSCEMIPCDDKTGYEIGTPVIFKKCACGAVATEIDNAMVSIYKMLIDKGYKVLHCCEGHAYNNYGVMNYTYADLVIDGYIRVYIPESYQKQFDITQEFGKTTICVKQTSCECGCICLDIYNEYKTDMLERLYNMVKSLPNNPDTSSSDDHAGCCGCQCDSSWCACE